MVKSKSLLIYKNPINKDGKEYWVPIVIKNKDTLIGYLNGMNQVLFDMNCIEIRAGLKLDSTRFTDIIDDKGTHALKLSKEQLKKINEDDNDFNETQAENEENILEPCYLEVSCSCGNYVAFKNPDELSSESFICGICDKIIIQYTNHNDWEYCMSDEEEYNEN